MYHKFSCRVQNTWPDQPLDLVMTWGEQIIYQGSVGREPVIVRHFFDDEPAIHRLEFRLSDKTQTHTVLDSQGNLVNDARLKIDRITAGDIEIDEIAYRRSEYWHSNNDPDQAPGCNEFFGEMGCNGTIVLTFTTPLYLWLLENM